MTCILGLEYGDRVYIGGDSQVTQGWDKGVAGGKVFRVQQRFVVGCSGPMRLQNLLQYVFEPPTQGTETNETYMVRHFADALRTLMKDNIAVTSENASEDSGGAFLIGYKGSLYEIGSDFSVIHFERGYDAIGAGGDFAMGALAIMLKTACTIEQGANPAETLLKTALDIAGMFSITVCPPYVVESI